MIPTGYIGFSALVIITVGLGHVTGDLVLVRHSLWRLGGRGGKGNVVRRGGQGLQQLGLTQVCPVVPPGVLTAQLNE